MATATCIDCGVEIGGRSTRCKTDRGRWLSGEALRTTAGPDREILAMVDGEGLNGSRVAERMGISRTRARQRILLARGREERRQRLEAAERLEAERLEAAELGGTPDEVYARPRP